MTALPKAYPSGGFILLYFFLREWLHFVGLFPESLPGSDGTRTHCWVVWYFYHHREEKGISQIGRPAEGGGSCSRHIMGSQCQDPTFNGKSQRNVPEGMAGIIENTSMFKIHSVHSQVSKSWTHLPKCLFGEKTLCVKRYVYTEKQGHSTPYSFIFILP
jgi:hypothetical protein